MKSKYTWENIKAYVQGKVRIKLFYSKYFNKLIPLHIFEQINYRIFKMRKACYNSGSCIKCGCETPALQMANKACAGYCYPAMKNAEDWKKFKYKNNITFIYRRKDSRDFELRIEHKHGK